MADATEDIALRLHKFIQMAETKANAGSFQTQVNTQPRTGIPKAPILATYEECLSKLTEIQLRELDRILEVMFGAFRSPPGAIIPA
jgi:hypothetical protein